LERLVDYRSDRATRDPNVKVIRKPPAGACSSYDPNAFLQDFERFYNIIFTTRIFRHLLNCALAPRYVHLEYLQLDSPDAASRMLRFLRYASPDQRIYLRCRLLELPVADLAQRIWALRRYRVDIAEDVVTISSPETGLPHLGHG
jgi:hypothetical protein